MSDRKCGNIKRPNITPQSFLKQTFLDSSAPNHKLVWDINSQKPVNNWQNLLENNTIKDYQLTNTNNKLTGMKQEGIFCFYIPTYNSEYGVKCDFNFPQVTQSYVIVNKFKNFFGNDLTHYIVVTPTCTFYKPCSNTKLLSDYDILHIKPVNESFMGTNNIRYKHIYYVAQAKDTLGDKIDIDPNNINQISEISDIQWVSFVDALKKIRSYNIEKKNMLEKLNKILVENYIK